MQASNLPCWEAIVRARGRGVDWLIGHLQADGSFAARQNILSCYSKAPLALLKAGQGEAAMNVLDWIEQNYLRADGDVRTTDQYKLSPSPESSEWQRYLYHNGWVCVSAQLNGRFGLARTTANFLAQSQNPKNGGFYSNRLGGDFQNLTDVASTSSACLALLQTGRLDELGHGARYLARMVDDQQQRDVFCLYRDEADRLVEKLPQQNRSRYLVEATQPKQNFWMLGFAAAILAQTFNLTRASHYLDHARKYQEFLFRCPAETFASFGCWKHGWASALIYRETGERAYRDKAVEVLDYIVNYQDADGAWRFGKDLGLPDADDALVFDLTAEMVLWLFELPKYLDHE